MATRVFVYSGKNAAGKPLKGEVEAQSEMEARIKLRAQRVIPIRVVEKGQESKLQVNKKPSVSKKKAKAKDLQVFTRQFATMISSGIPIVQCIEILAFQSANLALRDVLIRVKEGLEGGRRLADSMTGYPGVFNDLYVSLVRAGEEGGALDVILARLAQYIEKSVKLKNKVIAAMWYPVAILIVAFCVVVGLLTFVIPKFESLFAKSGSELPGITQMVVNASHFMQSYWWAVIGGVILTVFAIFQYYETPDGRARIDGILIDIPLFGDLIQKNSVARFSRTMQTMLSSGVGILDGLDICSKVVGNVVMEKALMRAKKAISEGKSITQPLMTEKYIPKMVVQMIGVGEATGKLDTMLGKIADFYEDEVEATVGALTSIMEPVMMVVLGGIIAFIVIAMYLPIFKLAGAMGG